MRTLLVATLVLAPALASADDSPPAKTPRTTDVSTMRTDDCARARKANKPCVLSIEEGDSIEGNAPTAGGQAIGVVTFGRAASLIRIRKDFITEILKSAEDID